MEADSYTVRSMAELLDSTYNQDTVHSMAELLATNDKLEQGVTASAPTLRGPEVFYHDVEDDLKEIDLSEKQSHGEETEGPREKKELHRAESFLSKLSNKSTQTNTKNTEFRLPNEFFLKLVVVILLVLMISSLIIIYQYHAQHETELLKNRYFVFDEETGVVTLKTAHGKELMKMVVLIGSWPVKKSYDCTNSKKKEDEYCLIWLDQMELMVERTKTSDYEFLNVTWKSATRTDIGVCLLISDNIWYGGGTLSEAAYPFSGSFPASDYVTSLHQEHGFGSYIQPLWFTSAGASLVFPADMPYKMSLGSESVHDINLLNRDLPETLSSGEFLCITTPSKAIDTDHNSLEYTVNINENPSYLYNLTLQPVREAMYPNIEISNITILNILLEGLFNEETILRDSDTFKQAFDSGIILIPLGWESHLGDFMFDESRFPDVQSMINQLNSLGFQIGLSVHPLIGVNSDTYKDLDENYPNYFISNAGKRLLTYDEGPHCESSTACLISVLDINNEETRLWFMSRITSLIKKYNIHLLYFESGTVQSSNMVEGRYCNDFSKNYANLASVIGKTSNILSVIDTGLFSQNLPVIHSMNVQSDDILSDVVKQLLSMSTVGYDYSYLTLPIIDWSKNTLLGESREDLYRAWNRLAALMPVMQIGPDLDLNVTLRSFKEVQALRKNVMDIYVFPAIMNNKPLVRPVWVSNASFNDSMAQICDNEFILADSLLVVFHSNGSLFIPEGIWLDPDNDYHSYQGPGLEDSTGFQLEALKYFVKKEAYNLP